MNPTHTIPPLQPRRSRRHRRPTRHPRPPQPRITRALSRHFHTRHRAHAPPQLLLAHPLHLARNIAPHPRSSRPTPPLPSLQRPHLAAGKPRTHATLRPLRTPADSLRERAHHCLLRPRQLLPRQPLGLHKIAVCTSHSTSIEFDLLTHFLLTTHSINRSELQERYLSSFRTDHQARSFAQSRQEIRIRVDGDLHLDSIASLQVSLIHDRSIQRTLKRRGRNHPGCLHRRR